jgi:hypothetical protein
MRSEALSSRACAPSAFAKSFIGVARCGMSPK